MWYYAGLRHAHRNVLQQMWQPAIARAQKRRRESIQGLLNAPFLVIAVLSLCSGVGLVLNIVSFFTNGVPDQAFARRTECQLVPGNQSGLAFFVELLNVSGCQLNPVTRVVFSATTLEPTRWGSRSLQLVHSLLFACGSPNVSVVVSEMVKLAHHSVDCIVYMWTHPFEFGPPPGSYPQQGPGFLCGWDKDAWELGQIGFTMIWWFGVVPTLVAIAFGLCLCLWVVLIWYIRKRWGPGAACLRWCSCCSGPSSSS